MGMAGLAIILLGYMQPHARYAYRTIKHNLTQASLGLAVKEGSFLQIDGLTFFAETSLDEGSSIRLALRRSDSVTEGCDAQHPATSGGDFA